VKSDGNVSDESCLMMSSQAFLRNLHDLSPRFIRLERK
jgi:hypothetical protein